MVHQVLQSRLRTGRLRVQANGRGPLSPDQDLVLLPGTEGQSGARWHRQVGGGPASLCAVPEVGSRPRTPSSPLDPWCIRVYQHHSSSPTVAPARKSQLVSPHGWNGVGESGSGAHCPPRGMVDIGGSVGTIGTCICDRSHGRIPVHTGRGTYIVETMVDESAHPGHHRIHGGRGAC